jgi:hypothetical protein
MLANRRKVFILVPLGFPFDVFRKLACGMQEFQLAAPPVISRVSNVLRGVAYGT